MAKFCELCGSVFGHSIEKGVFSYICTQCGNTSVVEQKCITVNELTNNAHDFQLNKNMVYDNTLPRTRQINCPSCKTQPQEIVIFQYNPDMLNVGYMCVHCKNYWKN